MAHIAPNNDIISDEVIVFSEDPRIQELQSCQVIFPNLDIDYGGLKGCLAIPFTIEHGLDINLSVNSKVTETVKLHNLPAMILNFQLPEEYPDDKPPKLYIKCNLLTSNRIKQLELALYDIWNDMKDHVLFSMIDYLHDRIQNHVMDLIANPYEIIDAQTYLELINFDRTIKQQEFENKTFSCEICQQDYKGIKCEIIESCGHVFCNDCLYDYFSSCIISGDVSKIHCPDFECTKKYVENNKKLVDSTKSQLNPLQINQIMKSLLLPTLSINFLSKVLLRDKSQDLVKRYYTLFKEERYDLISNIFPHRLIPCPRTGCEEKIFRENMLDNLMKCPKCKYAFCANCFHSYHGDYKPCATIAGSDWYNGVNVEHIKIYMESSETDPEYISIASHYGKKKMLRVVKEYEMDLLFKQFKEENDVCDCPKCKTPIERIDGCNKMECKRCLSSFCFLCGESIHDYSHFNEPSSNCYNLLFFGAPGHDEIVW
ncbi:uncharacterized protein RJT21DRAFT_1738 [Scheffersomyces amazonensis]|uniref:uncharacterized protein n=1 Tax=Scheffersomyces amazonensis TaxID=1078765 RepID=UPI00315DC7CE